MRRINLDEVTTLESSFSSSTDFFLRGLGVAAAAAAGGALAAFILAMSTGVGCNDTLPPLSADVANDDTGSAKDDNDDVLILLFEAMAVAGAVVDASGDQKERPPGYRMAAATDGDKDDFHGCTAMLLHRRGWTIRERHMMNAM
jgi:hypothetical protein